MEEGLGARKRKQKKCSICERQCSSAVAAVFPCLLGQRQDFQPQKAIGLGHWNQSKGSTWSSQGCLNFLLGMGEWLEETFRDKKPNTTWQSTKEIFQFRVQSQPLVLVSSHLPHSWGHGRAWLSHRSDVTPYSPPTTCTLHLVAITCPPKLPMVI